MKRIKEERVCSFCTETTSDSFGAGKGVMCAKCHYLGNVQMGNVPRGSIYCFKCKTHSQFRAINGTSRVEFIHCLDDSEGIPIYIPVKCEGKWDKHSIPDRLECGSCGVDIPTIIMYLNNWTTPIVQ